jgi:sigma-54 dependent transcriptional regulator, acetoin dehydrogenase operon transcriptional activator AcoR
MQPDLSITEEVWRHYVVTQSIPEDVLREPIYRAWRRCDQVGASPFVMQARELRLHQVRALFERERNLIESARPYLQALSRSAGEERHAAMLGDSNAVVIDVLGDAESVHGPQRVPGPGALLAEQQAGANGIGSPLAEGGYIELVGPEHFIEGFHPFTCQGLPLTGPDGEIAGVLSTSVRRVEASQRIREILFCAARGIEAELIRRQLSLELQSLLAGDPGASLLERLQQDIVQMHGAARLRLEKAIRLAGSTRQSEAAQQVEAANALVLRFQNQSRLWREIASASSEAPDFHDLERHVREMAALLTTEATVRGLEIEIRCAIPVQVYADRYDLQRTLFRAFLRALESSAPKTTMPVEVVADEPLMMGIVRFPASPDVVVTVAQHPAALLVKGMGSFEVGDDHESPG